MSWHYLQEQEAASWAGSSLVGAPSVLLKLMPTAEAFSLPGSETDSSSHSRFGMTSAPSTGSHGPAELTSSAAASPAKTSASQAEGGGLTEPVLDSGFRWPGSFAKYDPLECFWRIRQCSFLGVSVVFSGTFPRWGSVRDGECSALAPLVLHTHENGCSLWPTVCARDFRGIGRSRMERTGSKSGECLPQAIGGLLNPPWAEWLMGWPGGWTELRPLEMGKFQQWLRSHGRS